MATLAKITWEARIILKLLAASVFVVAAIFIIFRGGNIIKDIFFPTPPLPPEEKFGKLPRVKFPSQNPFKFEYRINTLTGRLPTFPDRMNVYKTKRDEPNLVALKSARDNVSTFGYSENETKVNESVYQWSSRSGDKIEVNILTNHFRITSSFLVETPPKGLSGTAAKIDGAFKTAMDFLISMGEDISDLDQDKSRLTYWKISDGRLIAADRQTDAQFSRLDIFQKNIDKDYKIYYLGLTQSTMYFIFRNENDVSGIVDASFAHFIPAPQAFSTYPIKTADQAYEDLKSGNAYIFTGSKNSDSVDITEVELGYYVGQENQLYLLPIIIFKGKDFTAYVTAIPDSSIGN